MKKSFLVMLVAAGIFGFVACGPTNKPAETEAETTIETEVETVPMEEEPVMEDTTYMDVDSTVVQ
jgi:hypothetical protein